MSASAFALGPGSASLSATAHGAPVPVRDSPPPSMGYLGVATSALTSMCTISGAEEDTGATHTALTVEGGFATQPDASRVWRAPPTALIGDEWDEALQVRGVDPLSVLLFVGLEEEKVVAMGKAATEEWLND